MLVTQWLHEILAIVPAFPQQLRGHVWVSELLTSSLSQRAISCPFISMSRPPTLLSVLPVFVSSTLCVGLWQLVFSGAITLHFHTIWKKVSFLFLFLFWLIFIENLLFISFVTYRMRLNICVSVFSCYNSRLYTAIDKTFYLMLNIPISV